MDQLKNIEELQQRASELRKNCRPLITGFSQTILQYNSDVGDILMALFYMLCNTGVLCEVAPETMHELLDAGIRAAVKQQQQETMQ